MMPKFILLLILFLLSGSLTRAQGQENKFLLEEYLQQSERQKKTGLIMLGTGLGAAILGTAMVGAAWGGGSEFVGATGVVLMTAGTISTLVSIPVIVSSASKGRKAGKLSVITANAPLVRLPEDAPRYYPAVHFSYPLTSR